MKIAILGAGAMGSLVGAHLKKGGGQVYFVDVYEDHMKAVADKGITMELEGLAEPVTVKVDGTGTNGDAIGICDVVVMLVKCYDTENAITANRTLFGTDTVIITLQNGVGGADLVANHFDKEHIGMGVLKASANLLGPGRILGSPKFANSPKGVYFSAAQIDTPYRYVFDEFEKLLTAGGMPAEYNEKTEAIIWDKLVNNVMYNGVAALLLLANEISRNHEDGNLLMKELARETCEVACAKGIDMPFEKYWKENAGEMPSPDKVKSFHYVSMCLDSYNHRKTEIDFINGSVVREGKKYGIPTPYNETIWRLVRILQDTYNCKYEPQKA